MGMAFDHQLGEGDALDHGTATAPSGFDPIMLVIAAASGCLFVTLLISCVCCSRRPERHPRNAHLCSRRDTVPLEDLLSKPTLADPESFFSEAPLDDKDPPHTIGYWTSNDDTSVASMSQMSDLSTSELVGSDPGQNHASMLERKSKSEKVKRSKNFQNHMLNNELRASAKEYHRQGLDYTTQNNTKITVNDTQMDKLREDDFLYKKNDFDYVNAIQNTTSKRGNIDNKLKKTDNKDPSSTQGSLDVTAMTEDRVSSESFTSSARGSISHDMTASVNVLRLPRQSLIPQAESFSGNLLEERSILSEVKEIPSSPTNSPPVQFSLIGQNAAVEDGQSIQSATKSLENNTTNKSPQDPNEALVDNGNSSGPHSDEIRPRIQETPNLRHSPEGIYPVQSSCNKADQTSARIPERISLNLQIDFHFSDTAGCCGNQTRSYVVCSPVSVSQETREDFSSRVGAITTSSCVGEQPQNSIPDNANCALVRTDRSKEQPYSVIDKTNNHSILHSELTCEGIRIPFPSTRKLDDPKKRFSTPIDFITARGMNDIELQSIEKRRFTVSDVADIEVVLKERKLIQMPGSEIVHHPSRSKNIDMESEKKSLPYITTDSQSMPSEVLASSPGGFMSSSHTEPNQNPQKNVNASSQESHPSAVVNDTNQIQDQRANSKISMQESHLLTMVDNNDPDQRQQECTKILSPKPITGNDVGEGKDSESDNQGEGSGIVSFTAKPEADMEDNSSNNDTVYVPDQENEISRPPNGESGIITSEKSIAVCDSSSKAAVCDLISEAETKDHDILPLEIETETRVGEKLSSLSPLNASILEGDEDFVLQSEEGSIRIGNSTKEIQSNKIEQKDGHDNSMPFVNNEESDNMVNENDKHLNDKRPQCSVNDTPVDDIETGKTGVQEETLQSRQHIQANEKLTSDAAETNGDVVEKVRDKMTGSENITRFDQTIPNENDKTSCKVKQSGGENELTQQTSDQTADDKEIKATHETAAANCNRNTSTCNQLFENDNLNSQTKCSVGEAKNEECLEKGQVPHLDFKPGQEQENLEKEGSSREIIKTQVVNESQKAKSHETQAKVMSKQLQGDTRENTSNTLPTNLKDQKVFECNEPSDSVEKEEKPPLKGILRINRSFDMTFKEQDNLNMNFYPIQNKLGSTTDTGQSEFKYHQNVAPFVFVSDDINVDKPALSVKTESEEGVLSPTLSLPPTEDKAIASDESDYDNPWDSLDEAVKRGSMRYNRRASRVADGSDAKTLMLKSAEDLGRLLEDAERRRRMRQNAARSSCQITDTTPPSPPPTFTRLSPFRHTVKGIVSHGSSKDLQDDALKSHPIKGKKDRQRSKDDLSHDFTVGIDPNRAKTIAAGERSKIYSPETKKRKGLLHRK